MQGEQVERKGRVQIGGHTKTLVSFGSEPSVRFSAVCISAAVPSKNLPHPRKKKKTMTIVSPLPPALALETRAYI